MTKIIGIANSCKDCSERHYYSGGAYECLKVRGSRLNADSSIPAWCPLPDHPADAIESLQRDNAALMEDSTAQVQIAKEAVERAAGLRQAIATVCEGWTLPGDARKILESALWAPAALAQKEG